MNNQPQNSLHLFNSLHRRLELFEPLEAGKVGIYCCGVTVYDLCHLGHARSYIAWDVLRRYLQWRGYAVTFVQNYTDIDDKILNRAAAEGTSMDVVSDRNIKAYEADMETLNILPADRMPRATRCLDGIRALISELEAKGAAYSAAGDVYFAVAKAQNYGQLSGRDPNDQQQGASGRTSTIEDGRKQHPFDFALWKGSKPGEPSFPSPWGPGRPGWHIECSAMVRQELGETIDIHLGSETASGKPLARYWLHNGMVNVGGTKMSKSLGNFTTIRGLLESGVSAMTLRLFVLQAHYRKPLDFTAEALDAAATGWKGLNGALLLGERHHQALGWAATGASDQARQMPIDPIEAPWLSANRDRFMAAMDDDLNSSAALAVLFELARPLRALANRLERGDQANEEERSLEPQWQLLQELAAVLGLKTEGAGASQANPETSAPSGADGEIQQQIEARRIAKAAKNFVEADRIRDEFRARGMLAP
ncbi:MAG: cysteine--tRNA ligase [Synechococcaceae bacterium WB6_3B_236]|nr:cysteine--tRNA ligase [Synechococcaceae bacterium WB6_3B_236]